MAGRSQAITDLIINLKAKGAGEVEYLRDELGKLQKTTKLTADQLDRQRVAVKNLGRATKDTTSGMRLQVNALQKIRTNASVTGASYARLTRDINKLNSALKEQVNLEKGVGGRGGRTLALPFVGMREGARGRDLTTGLAFDDKRTAFNKSRQGLGLEQLVAASFFANQFKKGRSLGTPGPDTPSGFQNVPGFQLKQHNQAVETLTKALNGQLTVTEDLRIQSKAYRDILTNLKTVTQTYTASVQAQDAWASRDVAVDSSRRRYAYGVKEKFGEHRRRGFGLGRYGLGVGGDPEGGGLARIRSDIRFQTPKLNEYKQLPGPAQFVKWLFETPKWKSMKGEMKGLGAKETGFSFGPKYGQRKDVSFISDMTYGVPLRGSMPKGLDTLKVGQWDRQGIGLDPSFPRTKTGYQQRISDLAREEENLDIGSKEQIRTRKELDKVTDEYNKALGLYEKRLKGINTLQSKLGQRRGVGTRDSQTGAMIGAPGSAYVGERRGGGGRGGALVKYDPSAQPMQTVQSLQEFVRTQEKLVATSGTSINTLSRTRSKLEEIKNTLDPTSKNFNRVTQAIAKTDKALTRLNSNKFSGASLARTGQAVLGAGFFGGPAGFLGAGIGAGVNALRPGGDMQQGAITGGLVASQVLNPIAQGISGSTDYAAEYSKAQKTLKLITKDAGSYGVAMEAVTTAVEEYNVPQEVAIRGMTRLSAAVLGSGGNINNAAEAFLNTTAAIKGTAGSADDVKSAITAMVQIYSKGKVSAEELSGQLGERFPAAVTKFADANKLSTQELQKSLKDGTVGLDMLSKFVASLGDEYAPLAKKIAESNEEAGARSRVAMNKLRISIGDTLIPIGKEFQEIGANILVDLIPSLSKLASFGGSVFKIFASIIASLVENFNILSPAITTATVALVAYNVQQAIATKTGIALMATQAYGAMMKLIAAIKAGTIVQTIFNAVVSANPYVAAAVAIAAIASSIWAVVSANKALKKVNDGGSPFGDITGMTLEETKRNLEAVNNTIKMYQDIINDPETDGKKRKGLSGMIDTLKEFVLDLETQITKLGGKHDYDKLGGDKSGYQSFWDDLTNGAKHAQEVFTGAFKKMEDSLTEFVMTGKLNFKSFARSIIADLARMIIKAAILGPLFKFIAPVESTGWFSNAKKNALGNVYGQNGIVPFARGGVVDSPTLFPFANGAGLMGEAGPEAIIPLKRGRDGRLGVAGGGGTNIAVNVDATGSSAEGDTARSRELGGLIGAAIQNELVKQKRPGGLLA